MPTSARVLTVGAGVVASPLLVGAATASATPASPGDDGDRGGGEEVTLRFDVETSPFSYTDLGGDGSFAESGEGTGTLILSLVLD